jgi:uncharacterized protein (DUF983 family)
MEVPPIPERNWKRAALVGLRGRCPCCGRAPLFARTLRTVEHCPACGQDWTHQRADDFPAYLVILVVGHVVVPLFVLANAWWDWPLGLQMALWPAMTALLAVLLIRPAKGAVIGVQWALGMEGFGTKPAAEVAERRP